MSAKTNTLMDVQLLALEGEELALFTVAPTQTTNGTQAADADYINPVVSLGAVSDGSTSGTREASGDAAFAFGTTGAVAGYSVVAVGAVDAVTGDALRWVAYSATIAIGEIPRIPVGEITFIEG